VPDSDIEGEADIDGVMDVVKVADCDSDDVADCEGDAVGELLGEQARRRPLSNTEPYTDDVAKETPAFDDVTDATAVPRPDDGACPIEPSSGTAHETRADAE